MADPGSSGLYVWYQKSFFIIPFSLVCYTLFTFSDDKKSNEAIGPKNELIIILCGLFLFIAALSAFMYLCWGILHLRMGIDYRYFSHLLLLLSTVFIFRYFCQVGWRGKEDLTYEAGETAYANTYLDDLEADQYVNRIQAYFGKPDNFLRADLSLELISAELEIPKHRLSHLFNVHIGKSFYNYVADHRIAFALTQLEDDDVKITIEALAYECGFNSKSSFNKHFKSITGLTPLEYLNRGRGEFLLPSNT